MPMFMFHYTILGVGMRAGDTVNNAMGRKNFRERSKFPSLVGLKLLNFGIKLQFNISLKFNKDG